MTGPLHHWNATLKISHQTYRVIVSGAKRLGSGNFDPDLPRFGPGACSGDRVWLAGRGTHAAAAPALSAAWRRYDRRLGEHPACGARVGAAALAIAPGR